MGGDTAPPLPREVGHHAAGFLVGSGILAHDKGGGPWGVYIFVRDKAPPVLEERAPMTTGGLLHSLLSPRRTPTRTPAGRYTQYKNHMSSLAPTRTRIWYMR